MRLRALIAWLVAAGAVIPTALAAHDRSADPCASPVEPVVKTDRVLLWQDAGWDLVGCLRGRAPLRLAEADEPDAVARRFWEAPVAAGAKVAYAQGASYKCLSASVVVYDLRRRRELRRVQAGSRVEESGANGCVSTGAPVQRIVLRRDGAAAFVSGWGGSVGYEVSAADGDALRSLAGPAAAVDPASLRLSRTGSSVTWIEGGVRKRAALSP
ncbi:MAG TPA: hypothetical protein VIL49_04785 [Capillimicrobium sp.]|jgi:hypothetical protein